MTAASAAPGRNAAPRPLPDGWRWARLGEVCRVFAGSAAPQGDQYFSDDGPFFFRVSDLGQHGRTTELAQARDRLSPLALDEKSLVMAKRGSVLFPKSGAAIALNHRALLAVDGYIVSHLMALEPGDDVLSEYIYLAICMIDMMAYGDNAGYPSLKQSSVERINIPIPPFAEQRRIADMVITIAKARTAAEEQLRMIDSLPAAIWYDTLKRSVDLENR